MITVDLYDQKKWVGSETFRSNDPDAPEIQDWIENNRKDSPSLVGIPREATMQETIDRLEAEKAELLEYLKLAEKYMAKIVEEGLFESCVLHPRIALERVSAVIEKAER